MMGSASSPGALGGAPQNALMSETPSWNPTRISSMAATNEATCSALPWPYGCSASGGVSAILTPNKATTDPKTSDAEWAASARSARLFAIKPTTTFVIVNNTFTRIPSQVANTIFFEANFIVSPTKNALRPRKVAKKRLHHNKEMLGWSTATFLLGGRLVRRMQHVVSAANSSDAAAKPAGRFYIPQPLCHVLQYVGRVGGAGDDPPAEVYHGAFFYHGGACRQTFRQAQCDR